MAERSNSLTVRFSQGEGRNVAISDPRVAVRSRERSSRCLQGYPGFASRASSCFVRVVTPFGQKYHQTF